MRSGNRHRPRAIDRATSRLHRAVVLAAAVGFATAGPALAHALDGAVPTNYRTRITSLDPHPPGLDVEVVEAGNRLELTNTTGTEAVVIGYQKEPYLRVGPGGVYENVRSPATYRNRTRFPTEVLPAKADATAEPEWEQVSGARRHRWHDHRVHYMGATDPPAVRADPGSEHVIIPTWEIPVVFGDERIAVRGDLVWVPGPSPWPWIAAGAAAGLAVAGAAFGAGPSVRRVVIPAALLALVALDATRLVGLAADASASPARALGSNPPALAAWVLGLLAAWRVAAGDARFGPALTAAAGVLFALGSATDLEVLSSSQLPTAAPVALVRLAVAAGLGVGLALVAAAFTPVAGRARLARA